MAEDWSLERAGWLGLAGAGWVLQCGVQQPLPPLEALGAPRAFIRTPSTPPGSGSSSHAVISVHQAGLAAGGANHPSWAGSTRAGKAPLGRVGIAPVAGPCVSQSPVTARCVLDSARKSFGAATAPAVSLLPSSLTPTLYINALFLYIIFTVERTFLPSELCIWTLIGYPELFPSRHHVLRQ